MSIIKPLVLNKEWEFSDNSSVVIGDRRYNIAACCMLSENLPIIEIPMRHMFLDYEPPFGDTLRSFAEHILQVLECDLDLPILLNENGCIIDGRHRLIRSMIEFRTTIKTRRFDVDPEGGYSLFEERNHK